MKQELIKNNYYEAVNKEWIDAAVIPGDQPMMSAFLELHLDIEKLLMDLAKKWDKDQTGLNNHLQEFVKLYKMTNDFATREKLGAEPLKPVIKKILNLKSLKDLEKNMKDFVLDGVDLPFSFMVFQDFKDSNNEVLYFTAANLFLPDTSYYENEETKQQLIGLFTINSL